MDKQTEDMSHTAISTAWQNQIIKSIMWRRLSKSKIQISVYIYIEFLKLNLIVWLIADICRLIVSAKSVAMKEWRTPHSKLEGLMRARLSFTTVSSAGLFLLSATFVLDLWLVSVCDHYYNVRQADSQKLKCFPLSHSQWCIKFYLFIVVWLIWAQF